MKNVTAIIISFLRPRYTIDCIKSLRETYPDINILVGEQVKHDATVELVEACKQSSAKYIELPWDCGVCYSRNRLMEQVETDYVLVGDDDFLYDNEAKVDKMVQFLDSRPEFDLVGGRIKEAGTIKNYQAYIELYDDHLEYREIKPDDAIQIDDISGLRYIKAELTFNFFVARYDVIKKVSWHEKIKVAFEHSHWFINLKKNNVNVAFSPDPIVKHKYQQYPQQHGYNAYRMRRSDQYEFFDSLGINYSIGLDGTKTTRGPLALKHDTPTKYYVKESVTIDDVRYARGETIYLASKQDSATMEKLRPEAIRFL